MYVDCPHCGGTGKVEHECSEYHLQLLESIYEIGFGFGGGYEGLGVYRCKVCGQLWKIRWQYDPGTGSDHIWLKPGEERRGYKFTLEEAAKYEQDTP